jgi:multiple sugar transport system permease protein
MIFPILYMISSSFKVEIDIFKSPFKMIPERFVNSYSKVWFGAYSFPAYYFNSLKITIACLAGLLVTSTLAAYGFSKITFKGRDVLFLIYMSTLMIPAQVTMVPRFLLYKWMHINNTHWALILPGMFTAFGTFLMRQFMVTIPYELNEAATIDGMGNLGILVRIITPMVKPALVTLMLISIVWSWNDYENAMLFLTRQSLYTIPLGLISFMDETGKVYSLIMAAAVSAVAPPMLLFFFGQRYFVEGLTAGAVKG